MSRTILSRLGAGFVATALVAGGSLLVAAPASAANDVVTPNSVVENTWGTEGGLTVTGTGTPGDDLVVARHDRQHRAVQLLHRSAQRRRGECRRHLQRHVLMRPKS